MLIKNYAFRYIDKKHKVYAVVRDTNAKNFSQLQFYTIPFPVNNNTNCIVTFLDKHHALYICDSIKKDSDISCTYREYSLDNLADFASSLKLPTLTVVNMYCDMGVSIPCESPFYEIHYSFNPEYTLFGISHKK